MRIGPLAAMELGARRLRDRWIVRPLTRWGPLERAFRYDFEFAIKDASDHLVAFDPHDFIGKIIRRTGNWERASTELVFRTLRQAGHDTSGKVFLDIGANIGTQSLYALVGGYFARAICVEPVASNLRCLGLNAYLNDLADRMKIVPLAAGDAAGTLELAIVAGNSGGHSFVMDRGDAPRQQVRVSTVDSILAEAGVPPRDVGLLWIDVEGFERQVIAGAATLIEQRVPVALEFTPQAYGADEASALLAFLGRTYRQAGVIGAGGIALGPASQLSLDRLPSGQVDLLYI